MNDLINKRIEDNQFFNITEGHKVTIGESKKIGIVSITDYVTKKIFTGFNQTQLKNDQYQVLQCNLKSIKTKIDKHNDTCPVKCAYWLGLNILINKLGLDRYNFFANLKTCDTDIIDNFIDDNIQQSLKAEGFDEEVINNILDFIRSPKYTFSLSCNSLPKIPTIIFTHPAFSRLKKLDLSANEFTTLPAEIGNLNSLQKLDLTENQLTTLPAKIGNLTSLQVLYLFGNELTTLPVKIDNLANLQKLNLKNNINLRDLLFQILGLPQTCTVQLAGCELSQTMLTKLKESTSNQNYVGPKFDFSID